MSNKKTLEEFKREVFNVFGGNAEVIGQYKSSKELDKFILNK